MFPPATRPTIAALAAVVVGSSLMSGAAVASPSHVSARVGHGPKLVHSGTAYLDHRIDTSKTSAISVSSVSGLNFVATFDASITDDPNAAAIEQGITDDLNALKKVIRTPITVTLAFASVPNGLGGAATYYNDVSYAQYRADLKRQVAPTVFDALALRSLPATTANPVNGGTDVHMTLPLLRAAGETALGNVGAPVDSTILLNTSLMNFSRSGPQDPNKYDLRQVAMHEIVEVLGAGGAGDSLLSSQVGPMDLFRYSAKGVRSYTTDPTAKAYFSITSGLVKQGYFNQDPGGDYGDWSHDLNGRAQVQDAFSTPGLQLNLDLNELIALDVLGYRLG